MKTISVEQNTNFQPITITLSIESAEERDHLIKMANSFIADEITMGGYDRQEKSAVELLVETVGFALQNME